MTKLDICTDCQYRDTCTKPCEKVEQYISKDYVPKREKCISELATDDFSYNDILDNAIHKWHNNVFDYYKDYEYICTKYDLTDRQSDILYCYMFNTTNQSDIAKELNVSKSYIYKVIKQIGKKLVKEAVIFPYNRS